MISFRGQPVSEGIAAGELYLADPPARDGRQAPGTGSVASEAIAADVSAAFAAVAAERTELAGRLRDAGRDRDADIVAIGALMAADPALTGPALDAVRSGTPADAAVRDAADAQAVILEALPDPDLAQRGGDVRQVAAAVVARMSGAAAAPPPPQRPFILVRRDVDPADLIRLADGGPAGRGFLAGVVCVGGGASSHASIIARGLGLPMLAGADEAVLAAPPGHPAIIDAAAGELTVDPPAADLARITAAGASPLAHDGPREPPGRVWAAPLARGDDPPEPPGCACAQSRERATPGQVHTADGELVTVLCNVASAAETRLGLAGGAAGVGLLRTEIPFTHATAWPARAEHLAQLRPVLRLLDGAKAVVRLLDFSGDKVPPFAGAEGLRALLEAPRALADQLAAILEAGRDADLAVMIPMVTALDEVDRVRGELAAAAKRAGVDPPALGIMVEVAATAAAADRFAAHVDFFSVGTNDLTADVLRAERAALLPSSAAEPAVLAAIARVVRAASQARIGVSVCGDAAADRAVLPLLIGAGVRTVSVGAARVPHVARWITEIDANREAARVAQVDDAAVAAEQAEVIARAAERHAR
jgi:phosphoenolpyruvate-protein kinase (PTS system EI component)